MAIFPSYTPSDRVFIAGQLPVREYRTMAGTVWKRILGNRQVGHQLSMTFLHVKSAVADEFELHWEEHDTVEQFQLPIAAAAGNDGARLRALIQRPDRCLWVWKQPPTIRDIVPGISTVQVELKGELPY